MAFSIALPTGSTRKVRLGDEITAHLLGFSVEW